jgi:hypothetical protein
MTKERVTVSSGVVLNRGVSETTFHRKVALSFVIPSEAEGSAVPRTSPGNASSYSQTELSSRPERTRISCHEALDTATGAAFSKESRMKFANATNTNRKSGVAEWRDLRFPSVHSHTL